MKKTIEMIMSFVFIVLLFCSSVYSKTEEELKYEFKKIVMKCTKEHPVEMVDLMALESLQVPKKKEVQCLLACAYKTEGTMNAKGMYDLEHAYKVAEISKNGDEKRFENAKKMADVCAKVNEVEVSDSEKGCERAVLIFKCVLDNAPKSKTEEELKYEFKKIVMKCTKEHPVEMVDLMALESLQVPKKKEVQCLLACAYKTEGTMNAKGMYDLEHAYKVAEISKNGDEKRFENAKKMADVCAKVNEVEVSDSEKGCERAVLIFKCVLDNAPKFGFKV